MHETIHDILNLAQVYEHRLPAPDNLPQAPVGAQIAGWIDYTLLKPEATMIQIEKLCAEAQQYGFASVCVNPTYVPLAAKILSGSPVKVCTVVGFPLGATLTSQKANESLTCLDLGASEIDMVINIGAVKGREYVQVFEDVQAVVQSAQSGGGLVKVILETGLLTRLEKIVACLLCKAAGADYIKTSTGFGPGGATVEDIDLIYRTVGPQVKVKASGGIRDLEIARAMIQAGASRLGASAGVQILKEAMREGKLV